ncbi:Detected protein of confused Function [Hibiscus syriacus]|uniref:Detected protein of confused Function n=1 Tax=Hibiscus syriacus TaxID=106335 RepID=A0A6A3CM85_HIBSY|nr:Detected protein of confused Function [Hibiscus syriacus]
MGFVSFVGRVLFALAFLLSAWQEFNELGDDGGPAAKALKPKFDVFSKTVSAHTGVQVPKFDIKYLVAASIAFKGVGGILLHWALVSELIFWFVLQQLIVTPILYDFYNYDTEQKEFGIHFTKFTQNLALLGALFFFIGMKNSMPKRRLKKKGEEEHIITWTA